MHHHMASFLKHTTPIQLAAVFFLTAIATPSLSSPPEKLSTISAAPTLLPAAPTSVLPPELAPDITPLLPSPRGIAPSPGDLLPTIPSNRSPPNPDEAGRPAPSSEVSPSGSFTAMAPSSSSTSVATPLSSAGCSVAFMLWFGSLLPLAFAGWC